MNSSLALSTATFIYALSSVFYIGSFAFKKQKLARIGYIVLIVGCLDNLAGFILRWIESYQIGYGHIPLSNMYESLVFFALTVGVLYLFVEYKYRESIIGVFATPLIFLIMAYASFDPNTNTKIMPLLPALKSNWLTAHVITCFLGYAGFAVSFGFSVMYLMTPSNPREGSMFSKFPTSMVMDELIYQMVVFGFLFLTIGIITGSVWATSAWGRWWSWDPKETWSLITWFVYAIFLHLRLMRGWQGHGIAWVSIIGFACVLFTYFGVNLFLSGLHSYA